MNAKDTSKRLFRTFSGQLLLSENASLSDFYDFEFNNKKYHQIPVEY
jgi:hypothetical protein